LDKEFEIKPREYPKDIIIEKVTGNHKLERERIYNHILWKWEIEDMREEKREFFESN
jgi:hypothetical protein